MLARVTRRTPGLCSPSPPRPPPGARTLPTITIGLVRERAVGLDLSRAGEGLFPAPAGVEVKIETIDSAAKIIPFVAQGAVQIAQGGISAAYFNAVGDGLPIILGLEGGSTPVYHNVVVRAGSSRAQITKIADLKGRNAGGAGGTPARRRTIRWASCSAPSG